MTSITSEKTNKENIATVTVAIIGAKGFANYGGYETFVDKITELHQNNPNINYLIACKANGKGCIDESLLDDAYPISENEFIYHNAHCFKISVPLIGSAQAVIYDLKAAKYVINYFKKNKTENPILYVLTCRIGPFIKYFARKIHKLGGVYILNPDGHEYLCAYWSKSVRSYWKYSEKLMIKHSDKVVCDSRNIETYIKAKYEKYQPDTTYIAYGADLNNDASDKLLSIFSDWMKLHSVKSNSYYLIVGRFVPENNYETIIGEFINSDTDKNLVIITDKNSGFFEELENKLHFSEDNRIKFVGTVYNQELLKLIRANAYAYIHGHEVGGTNPSLLESLSFTKLNLLLDVGFNRECGDDGALYWNKNRDILSKLINKCDLLSEKEVGVYGEKAREQIKDKYNWEYIAEQYTLLYLSLFNNNHCSDVSETCNIMGVNIAVTNMEKTLNIIMDNLVNWKGKYICVSNVHTTVMAYKDLVYRNVQNSSIMSLPDGGPLSQYSRKHGHPDSERVTGPDLMKKILSLSEKNGWKNYFYGSTPETLDCLKYVISERYSENIVCGMMSPPFRELTDDEDINIVDEINRCRPDFVWIALGAPKQELWMASHQDRINALMIGVGAAFDYESGNLKRAPEWMQKHNMEWVYRLLQDPKRLFARYIVTNSKFLWWKITHYR